MAEGRRRRAGAGYPPRSGARRGHRPPGPLPHLPGGRGAPDVRRRRTALPPAGRRATRRLRDTRDGQAGPGPAGATAATTGRCGGRGRRRDRPRVRLRWLGRRYGHRGSVGSLLAEFAAPRLGARPARSVSAGPRPPLGGPDLRNTGSPGWVYHSVHLGRDGSGADSQAGDESEAADSRDGYPEAGKVSCRLERTDGTSVHIGEFSLDDAGRGSWGAPMRVDPATVPGCRPRTAPSWPRPTSTHGTTSDRRSPLTSGPVRSLAPDAESGGAAAEEQGTDRRPLGIDHPGTAGGCVSPWEPALPCRTTGRSRRAVGPGRGPRARRPPVPAARSGPS